VKYFFDKNLSPHLAAAIGALCKPHAVQVNHIDQKFPHGPPDVEWIHALAQEGEWVIISQDRFTKNRAEREALKATGIVSLLLTKQWVVLKEWDKAWHLIRWWPRLMDFSSMVGKGAYFVPVKLSGKGKLEPVSL
jgi:hypothetical protein